ncbi:MAG TPA: diguanylate cyclase [Terracidiphilus sp.]|jgi:two-component system cell cycle response regulator|nr:diguanylate cyclase [Terracidiphilus sp.]
MPVVRQPTVLLASCDPLLLAAVEPVLHNTGLGVRIVLSLEAARATLLAPIPPDLALLDVQMVGEETGQLIATVRESAAGPQFPIVLLSDEITQEWSARLAESVLDDLIPRAVDKPQGRLRLNMVLRTYHRMREVERVRESSLLTARTDALTGTFNRGTLLAMLFRETDRVQRMKTPLSLLIFDIDDFGHWNAQLGADACDSLLRLVADRAARLFRSYDLFGRTGEDEFLVILPGCSTVDAVLLAERLRSEVFAEPFCPNERAVCLSAGFGITSSRGRSPVVVLREAEIALRTAKTAGPESIQVFNAYPQTHDDNDIFASIANGDPL